MVVLLIYLLAQTKKADIFLFSNWAQEKPIIDGYIDTLTEWTEATKLDISVRVPTYFAHKVYPRGSVFLYTMNDGGFLYLAIDVSIDKKLEEGDGIAMFFDDNCDKRYPSLLPYNEGELSVIVSKKGMNLFWGSISDSLINEWSVVCQKAYQSGCLTKLLTFISFLLRTTKIPEIEFESIPNLQANVGENNGHIHYEIAIPLNSKDDWGINASYTDTIGFSIAVRDAKGSFYGWWPSVAMDVHDPKTMGLLIFSNHD